MAGLVNIKELNTRRIIKLIRERGPISRIDISEITKIPRPTITRITEELLTEKIILEKGTVHSARGRRPVLLSFNPLCFYSIGVQISRSKASVALTDLDGGIRSFKSRKFPQGTGLSVVMAYIHQSIEQVIEEADIDTRLILGIGIGLPGPLNETEEEFISPPNFFGATHIPLRSIIRNYHKLPVFIDTTSNVAALAEKWFGQGLGHQNFLYVFAETGIGLGLFVNGNLYRGNFGEAGIIGHSTIDVDGSKCSCGNYGCLETFVSIAKLEETVRNKLKIGFTEERDLFTGEIEDISFEQLINALGSGSKLVEQLFEEAGSYLGVGIANAVNFFNPERVILGGKLGMASVILTESVKSTLETRVLSVKGKKTSIFVSELDHPVVLGAAALVIDDAFYLFS